MGLYVKVFEANSNNTASYGKISSLIKSIKAGCDFRVSNSDDHSYNNIELLTSVWSCNSVFTIENSTRPELNNAVCSTYQYAGDIHGFTAEWPKGSDNFHSTFYTINANPSLVCGSDFLINNPEVYSGIDNNCGPLHATWFTDPFCYFISHFSHAPNDLVEAMGFIESQNDFVG